MGSMLWKRLMVVLLLAVVGVSLSAALVKSGESKYSLLDREFYLTDEQVAFVRPGLVIDVTDYAIGDDGTVTVDFTVQDDAGLPLDLNGVQTPGAIRLSFLISSIPQGGSTYVSYFTRNVTSSITGDSAVQPTSDSGGTFAELGPGAYRYTFGGKLPADYDRDATHSIGYYAERNLELWEQGAPMADGVVTFVPSGGEVVDIRQVSTNEACAQCHDFLRLHGRRHSLELCVLCHYPGVLDPDTGNSVNMPILVHKIHRGAELENGYTIIGFQGSVHDYSKVHYPQDHRYCDTCHVEEAAQSGLWYSNPSSAACGACHDHVDFNDGVNHPVADDSLCANCHIPEGELEFDASVIGAHTIPSESSQLAGVNIEIVDVTNGGPGTSPTVFFTATNDVGEDIPLGDLNRNRFMIAGPTTDYSSSIREDVGDAAVPAGLTPADSGPQATVYSYTFEWVIPEDATGTYAIAPEARQIVTLDPGPEGPTEQRDTAENPVAYFAVTDAEAEARRMVVDDDKCENCHRNLALHGGNRHNAAGYCQFCHNPLAGDEEDPPESISFQRMIHRIHMGEELTRDYSIGGTSFNEVLYPSSRANCVKCHEGTSWTEARGVLSTITEREFFSPQPPNTTACLGCHDSVDAASHAYSNIAFFGEACMACHGEGKRYSVGRSHAE